MGSKDRASKGGRTHRCDTTYPQAPCCWAARDAEIAELEANDAARIAKYGSLSCPACGEVYEVEDGEVEDHAAACEPLTDGKRWS